MVLAREAFGRQGAEGPVAAGAIGEVVVGGQRGSTLVDKATTRLDVILQQIEDTTPP